MINYLRFWMVPACVALCWVIPACSDTPSTSSGTTNGESSSSSSSSSSASGSSSGLASGGAGGMGVGGQGGSGGSGMMLADLSDTFSGTMLSSDWFVYRPEVLDIQVNAGGLRLRLAQQALWFNDNRGPLVYKFVTGNFKATTRVHARKASNPTVGPDTAVHLAGLMARDPKGEMAGAKENYVFIVTGFDEVDRSVETKSTVNSVSTYDGPAWPSDDAGLRICRLGNTFYLYKRELATPQYTLAAKYDRPDLPATLQVGVNVYSLTAPDLLAIFEEVDFAPAATEADCAAF